jgi:hypothetical protein
LPKKCAKKYPGKEIFKLHSVYNKLTPTALQCPRAGKFKNTKHRIKHSTFFGQWK